MKKPDYSWIRKLDVYSPEEREAWIRYFESDDKEPPLEPWEVELLMEEGLLPGKSEDAEKGTVDFRYKVESVLQDVKDLLLKKNEAYGNSALEPINVFSKASAVEQIRVRLDDKLSRLYRGKEYGSEDTVTDLLGYIVLLKIAEKEQSEKHDQ